MHPCVNTDPAPASPPERERFFALLQAALADATFTTLVLAKPRHAEPGLQRVGARRLMLRGEDCLSFVYTYSTRDVTKNLPLPAALVQVKELIGPSFRNAHLHTLTEEVQLSTSKKGQCSVTVTKLPQALNDDGSTTPALPAPTAHNREKPRWLDLSRPFLVALGVTTPQHRLVPAMARKWKQIDKFIEILAHAVAASPLAQSPRVDVVDFGAGKGYLTFAVHEWLQQVQRVHTQVTGVELRPELVRLCNGVVAKLGLEGLHFEEGDVRSYRPAAVDVMIALHACDVATDHALHLGVRAGAQIILCSPCCHKQLRPQLLSPHALRPVLQHGVHVDQHAEMLTDSLRALLLDACGYDTQVFEFVSLEHTNKNKMILAVKRSQPKPADAVLAQIRDLKQFYGIREQCLETLLNLG